MDNIHGYYGPEKERENLIFDPKYVKFLWDENLTGKKVILAQDMAALKKAVNAGNQLQYVAKGGEVTPFRSLETNLGFIFAYYDPNFLVKKAFYEGKKIQYRKVGWDEWFDDPYPNWDDELLEYRIKSEDVYLKLTSEQLLDILSIVKERDENLMEQIKEALVKKEDAE